MSYSGFNSALLFAAALGLAGCPGDDSGDTSTTDAATTEATTASNDETGDDATTDAATTEEATTDEATSDESGTAGESGDAELGRIEVTVNYEGAGTGTLNVVLLTSFPPAGPPVAINAEMDATFPWTGTLSEIDPGDYFVFATLDIGNDNPTIPGDEDAQAMEAAMVTVVGGEMVTADLTLVDPR
ncbi:MAG: hypothetical protein AAF799_21690 [Myxococcota bacterium]